MWATLRSFSTSTGCKESTTAYGSPNVNEEYLSAFRTNSYADYFTKAQLLVQVPHSSSYTYASLSELLLEPGQESVAALLESAISSRNPDLKNLVNDYFEVSAEASKICTHILHNLHTTQSNHRFIQRALELIRNESPPEEFKSATDELYSFSMLSNPFSNPNQQEFSSIHDRYSSMLRCLKAKKRKVVRKMKLVKYLNRGSQVAVTAACGALAMVVAILAAHTLTGLLIGPALFSGWLPLKKRISSLRVLKNGRLRKLGEQLDVAAKGTYILNRDFDTMSRLVARLRDDIEHNMAIIQFCLERREDRFPVQEVLKELQKSDEGFMKQVEELEEHVYLCLVTINRARVLVIKEISQL